MECVPYQEVDLSFDELITQLLENQETYQKSEQEGG